MPLPPPAATAAAAAAAAAAHCNSDRLCRQVIAAMIQQRPFAPRLRPSPSFSGWTSELVCTVLSSIPRFFFLSPRSIGRQPFSSRRRSPLRQRFLPAETRPLGPSAARPHHPLILLAVSQSLDFYSSLQFPHDRSTCRAMARLLAKSNILPPLWRFLRANHHLVDIATVTSVIKILGDQGLAKEALAAFYRMKQLRCRPDVQCYNAVIAALCRVANFKNARSLLEQMELPGARCPPDTYTYTIFISFYCKRSMQTGCRKAIRRRMWEANHMFRRMLSKGFVPDVVTYNCLIDGLCKTYRIGRAHELFDDMLVKGCVPNRVTYNSFIRYYSVVNEVDKAIEMMREMVERRHGMPSSSSYTPVIHALCEGGRVNEAREFLLEMVNGGHIPREFTYKLVCDALSSLGEEGLSEEVRRRVDVGIDVRIKQVMRVKPLIQYNE